jgi:hypothetical protein
MRAGVKEPRGQRLDRRRERLDATADPHVAVAQCDGWRGASEGANGQNGRPRPATAHVMPLSFRAK